MKSARPFFARRQTGSGHLFVRNWCIKLPLTRGSLAEFNIERKLFPLIQTDPQFAPFALIPRSLFCIQLTPALEPFTPTSSADAIERYFRLSFSEAHSWPTITLRQAIRASELESFLSAFAPQLQEHIAQVLDQLHVRQSSAHGDFHPANILVQDGVLRFIDWGHYRAAASRIFDVISFALADASPTLTWFDAWTRLSDAPPTTLYSVPLAAEELSAYPFWRCAEDLWMLRVRGTLTERKAEKYVTILTSALARVRI